MVPRLLEPGTIGKGVARQSVKSELATAGAALHPCIYLKPCYNIINFLFEFEKTRALLVLLPRSFNQPWIPCFLMKLDDVNIKLDRNLTRNMIVAVNFIYF